MYTARERTITKTFCEMTKLAAALWHAVAGGHRREMGTARVERTSNTGSTKNTHDLGLWRCAVSGRFPLLAEDSGRRMGDFTRESGCGRGSGEIGVLDRGSWDAPPLPPPPPTVTFIGRRAPRDGGGGGSLPAPLAAAVWLVPPPKAATPAAVPLSAPPAAAGGVFPCPEWLATSFALVAAAAGPPGLVDAPSTALVPPPLRIDMPSAPPPPPLSPRKVFPFSIVAFPKPPLWRLGPRLMDAATP